MLKTGIRFVSSPPTKRKICYSKIGAAIFACKCRMIEMHVLQAAPEGKVQPWVVFTYVHLGSKNAREVC